MGGIFFFNPFDNHQTKKKLNLPLGLCRWHFSPLGDETKDVTLQFLDFSTLDIPILEVSLELWP